MKQRYHLLDALRGLVMLSMLGYHAAWDCIYIFGVQSSLLRSTFGAVWQSSIAWTFILLSGFCWSMGRRPLRHGAVCFGFGALMTVVTLAVMPQNRVLFGVLTLLGSSMMLLVPLEKHLRKLPAALGVVGSALLFWFTQNIKSQVLGFGSLQLFTLPRGLYQNNITAYFGFPPSWFYSTDYFPLLPWFFWFCTGYFLYRLATERLAAGHRFWQLLQYNITPLSFLGRHALVVYLFHQPVIYALLYAWFVLLA